MKGTLNNHKTKLLKKSVISPDKIMVPEIICRGLAVLATRKSSKFDLELNFRFRGKESHRANSIHFCRQKRFLRRIFYSFGTHLLD